MPIDSAERYPKQFATVLGTRMAYVETGDGDPIVSPHGNPNVVQEDAPDLIGRAIADWLQSLS